MIAAQIFLALGATLSVGAIIGQRTNNRIANGVLDAMREQFHPSSTRYTRFGRGIGIGFEMELDSAPGTLNGLITLMPRQAIMYLPIARALGRTDLLKLTCQCDALEPGVATLVGEGYHRAGRKPSWYVLERDADLREEVVTGDGRTWRLYGYNSLVMHRLGELTAQLAHLTGFNQLSVDSRTGTVTLFLTPVLASIAPDLAIAYKIIYTLTA